jgi:SAM-dependent methyltransferase
MKISIKQKIGKGLFQLGWPFVYALKKLSRWTYLFSLRYEFNKDWRYPPNPEWFDHELDLAFFPTWKKPHFFEKGVYFQEILKPEMRVLELCCGDASTAALFMAPMAKEILAVDLDPTAIAAARTKYGKTSNLSLEVMDICELPQFPQKFDLIAWDGAIAPIPTEKLGSVFKGIRSNLAPGGILAGSTLAKRRGEPSHQGYDFKFEQLGELETLLKREFNSVKVWERKHQDRTSFYFRCAEPVGTTPNS